MEELLQHKFHCVKKEFQIEVSRRQRIMSLILLIRLKWISVLIGILLVKCGMYLIFKELLIGWICLFVSFVLLRWFIFGIFSVLLISRHTMYVIIEGNGLGFGDKKPDCWMALDGVTHFQCISDIWVLKHRNNMVVIFPVDVLGSDEIDFFKQLCIRNEQQ